MDSGEERAPQLKTLRQKVEYMVEKTFPGQKVSGRFFSDLVKERGGSLSHSYFSNILAGKVTHPSEDILRALGLGFGVDWRFFKEESEVVDDVVAGLQFLAKRRTGAISGVAGRGMDDSGLPPELLRFALSLLEDTKPDGNTKLDQSTKADGNTKLDQSTKADPDSAPDSAPGAVPDGGADAGADAGAGGGAAAADGTPEPRP